MPTSVTYRHAAYGFQFNHPPALDQAQSGACAPKESGGAAGMTLGSKRLRRSLFTAASSSVCRRIADAGSVYIGGGTPPAPVDTRGAKLIVV